MKRFSSHSQVSVRTPRMGRTASSVNFGNFDESEEYRQGDTQEGDLSSLNGYSSAPVETILISVSLLRDIEGKEEEIKPMSEFSIEVFVLNRSRDVKRFVVSLADEYEVDEGVGKRRGEREEGLGSWEGAAKSESGQSYFHLLIFYFSRRLLTLMVGDTALRMRQISNHKSTASVVPLESDVRCGPLAPGTCQSIRIKNLAVREGVHRIGLKVRDVDPWGGVSLLPLVFSPWSVSSNLCLITDCDRTLVL